MSNNTLYIDIRKNIEAIIETNIPQLSDEYRELIVNSIMTTLRDSGLKPHTWTPNFITDLDDVKDWNICGYRVEELVKLALILRDRRIEDVDLRAYNDCFFDGYRKAYDEIHNRITKITDDLIEANNKFKGVEDN